MIIKLLHLLGIGCLLFSCAPKVETTKPSLGPITESIYSSGILKSKNQYEAFVTVSGVIKEVFVEEGDTVKKGEPIVSISNEAQRFGRENAQLVATFSDLKANRGKLEAAKLLIELSKEKMANDSLLYFRQKNLWQQQVGSKVELEQKQLAYDRSKTDYFSALLQYSDLKRQLDFSSLQSKKNLQISSKLESDYTLRSEMDGIVYGISKQKGEIVGIQTSIATIGDAHHFVLEMQVDEFDILKAKKGLLVLVTLDSYKGQVFEARITKLYPLMNVKSKTFQVEAEFTKPPRLLYPNTSFEANIVLQSKPEVLLIPRSFLLDDSTVLKSNGTKRKVKTGLKDYQKVEILAGIAPEDELMKPVQ